MPRYTVTRSVSDVNDFKLGTLYEFVPDDGDEHFEHELVRLASAVEALILDDDGHRLALARYRVGVEGGLGVALLVASHGVVSCSS